MISFDLRSDTTGLPADRRVEITLRAGEQRAEFFYERIFTDRQNFRGSITGKTQGPVAILALLQVRTPSGVQFISIEPMLRDWLLPSSTVYWRQPTLKDLVTQSPLDADVIAIDYFRNADENATLNHWDVVYETMDRATRRQIKPVNGALVTVIGQKTDAEFDDISLAELERRSYNASPIDMSEGSPNLATNFCFAIRTGLGNIIKVRVHNIVNVKYPDAALPDTYMDLAIEVYGFHR